MAKTGKKWIVLCSAALGAIYGAEYLATEANSPLQQLLPQYVQAAAQNGTGVYPGIQAPGSTPIDSSVSGGSVSGSSTPSGSASGGSASSSPTAGSGTNSLYKNGTYTGTGSNRRGTLQVAVTVQNDKITDVEIAGYEMHYSQSYIAGLPAQVLQNQSAQVDNVSGATFSTQAFEDAVQDALSQARNA